MNNKILRSESGFGIVQALAGLVIVTIALSGLFLSSYYAWHSSVSSYHYRVALLKAQQRIEQIKYVNRNNESYTDIDGIVPLNFIIDDADGEAIWGNLSSPSRSTYTDLNVSQYVDYDVISVKVTWRDGPEYYLNDVLNKEKTIILREDYFYRTDEEE
ncbi:MAG: hypothetical protein P9L97_11455 [Candidatus Tenebribacter davisii]|jgi:hypothetical protein|nr:hypothetical protein [Candidatus Tenebribacter davisii]